VCVHRSVWCANFFVICFISMQYSVCVDFCFTKHNCGDLNSPNMKWIRQKFRCSGLIVGRNEMKKVMKRIGSDLLFLNGQLLTELLKFSGRSFVTFLKICQYLQVIPNEKFHIWDVELCFYENSRTKIWNTMELWHGANWVKYELPANGSI